MSLFKADELEFNIDDLTATATQVNQICTDLRSAKSELRTSLDALRTEWDSDASTKFFTMYDGNWDARVENYCAMLEDLASALMTAVNEYGPVEDEFNNIDLDV